MLEKLKEIENLDLDEMTELKQAILAYDLGLETDTITIQEAENIETAIEAYYEVESIYNYVNEDIIQIYKDITEEN